MQTILVNLDNRLAELIRERNNLQALREKNNVEVDTLRRELNKKDSEARQQQMRLESRIHELEDLQKSLRSKFHFSENYVVLFFNRLVF